MLLVYVMVMLMGERKSAVLVQKRGQKGQTTRRAYKRNQAKKGPHIEERGPNRGDSNGILHGREEVPLRPSRLIMQFLAANAVSCVTKNTGRKRSAKEGCSSIHVLRKD